MAGVGREIIPLMGFWVICEDHFYQSEVPLNPTPVNVYYPRNTCLPCGISGCSVLVSFIGASSFTGYLFARVPSNVVLCFIFTYFTYPFSSPTHSHDFRCPTAIISTDDLQLTPFFQTLDLTIP